jgi:hypothetical protein
MFTFHHYLYSTFFFEQRDNDCLITLYQCKKFKSVAVLSTDNDQASISATIQIQNKYITNRLQHKPNEKSKPIIVLNYNSHKAGVDSVNQMARIYNVKAPTRLWSVQVFYNILNLAGINAWVMFKQVHGSSTLRRDYIIKLSEDILTLVSPDHVIASPVLASPPVKRKLFTEHQEENSPSSKKRFECQVELCFNRNTCSYVCFKCQRQVYGSCAEDILIKVTNNFCKD